MPSVQGVGCEGGGGGEGSDIPYIKWRGRDQCNEHLFVKSHSKRHPLKNSFLRLCHVAGMRPWRASRAVLARSHVGGARWWGGGGGYWLPSPSPLSAGTAPAPAPARPLIEYKKWTSNSCSKRRFLSPVNQYQSAEPAIKPLMAFL